MRHLKTLLAAGTLLASVTPLHAAEPACPDPRSSQFNFWIGSWEVTNADGSVAGRSRVEPVLDGCVLQETWAGRSGSAGTSLNFFDTGRGKWRQFWVWREGTTLELEGGMSYGAMLLEGDSVEDGKPVRNRISWTDPPDASVRQLWEISRDGGKTWQAIFDGTYRPVKTP
ncbi:MAG: hypothetical protein ABI567_03970 [Gammaproteobacteria bacterium]